MIPIEEEYKQYVVDEKLQKEVINACALAISMDEVYKGLQKDKRRVIRALVKNIILRKICFQTRDLLDEEARIFEEMIAHVDENQDLLTPMMEVTDDKTFQEVLKMLDFMIEHYNRNKEYYEAQLRAIDEASRGIGYVDNSKENTREAVKSFLEAKLMSMKEQKHLEKVDKM